MKIKKILLTVLVLFLTLGMKFYRYNPQTGQWVELTELNEYGSVEVAGEGNGGYCNKSVWDAGVSVKTTFEVPPELSFTKTAEAVTSNITTLPDGTFKVPNKQYAEWQVRIELTSDSTINSVIVTDNFGGEFGVELISVSRGSVDFEYQGETHKVQLEWTIGDNFSGTATLLLKVYTDKNSAGKQEFTSSGTHILNSGSVLKYRVGNTQHSVTVPKIEVISNGS